MSRAYQTDRLAKMLPGLPLTSRSGANVAPQIARYKGEQEAVRPANLSRPYSYGAT